MRKIQSLLDEYGESHQNPTNKMVHWICVPIIFWTITALFWSIKLPFIIPNTSISINVCVIALILVIIYYISLSIPLTFGMILFSCICCLANFYLEENLATSPISLWQVALIAFVLAWIGQFWGHNIEGKKPSFLKDLQFLLVGPAWLMHFIYKKIGLKY